MSKESLYLLNLSNQNHIKLLEEFEKENSLSLRENLDNDNPNEIDEIVFLEKDNSIKTLCQIHGERDIKTCNLTLFNTSSMNSTSKLLKYVTSYALELLGMEKIALHLSNKDMNMKSILIENDFEDLGEENGITIFLKEREEVLEKGISK